MTGSIRKITYKNNKTAFRVALDMTTGETRKRETYLFQRRKDAVIFLANQISDDSKGMFVPREHRPFKDAAEQWYREHAAEVSMSTARIYRSILDNNIYPYLGNLEIQSVHPLDIQRFYTTLRKKGYADGHILLIHKTLHMIFQAAIQKKWIRTNIIELVSLRDRKTYQPTIYDESELRKLLSCIKNSLIETPVILALYTGMRKGEILGLQWSDIDFEGKTIHVSRALKKEGNKVILGTLKTESSNRILTVSGALLAYLAKCREKQTEAAQNNPQKVMLTDYVCCNSKGKPFHPNTISSQFRNMLNQNDLRPIRFHDLRHMHATMLLKMGVPVKVVSARLGHTKIQTTMDIYVHADREMDEDAAEQISGYLRRAADAANGSIKSTGQSTATTE